MNALGCSVQNKHKRLLRIDNNPYLCSPKKLTIADVA